MEGDGEGEGKERERERKREREDHKKASFLSFHVHSSLTTFANVLHSFVKPPQIPVNPVSLVVKRQPPQLIEKWQILFGVFL